MGEIYLWGLSRFWRIASSYKDFLVQLAICFAVTNDTKLYFCEVPSPKSIVNTTLWLSTSCSQSHHCLKKERLKKNPKQVIDLFDVCVLLQVFYISQDPLEPQRVTDNTDVERFSFIQASKWFKLSVLHQLSHIYISCRRFSALLYMVFVFVSVFVVFVFVFVFIFFASPAPGSDMASAPQSCPEQRGGKNLDFCSSFPFCC